MHSIKERPISRTASKICNAAPSLPPSCIYENCKTLLPLAPAALSTGLSPAMLCEMLSCSYTELTRQALDGVALQQHFQENVTASASVQGLQPEQPQSQLPMPPAVQLLEALPCSGRWQQQQKAVKCAHTTALLCGKHSCPARSGHEGARTQETLNTDHDCAPQCDPGERVASLDAGIYV